jgi:hypothetical protein
MKAMVLHKHLGWLPENERTPWSLVLLIPKSLSCTRFVLFGPLDVLPGNRIVP